MISKKIKDIKVSKTGKSITFFCVDNIRGYIPVKDFSKSEIATLENYKGRTIIFDEKINPRSDSGWYVVKEYKFNENKSESKVSLPQIKDNRDVHKFIDVNEWFEEGEEENNELSNTIQISKKPVSKVQKPVEIKVNTISKELIVFDKAVSYQKSKGTILKYASDNQLKIGKRGNKITITDPVTRIPVSLKTFKLRYVKYAFGEKE